MGAIISQELVNNGSQLSGETKESFDQIVQALNHELTLRQSDHRLHHSFKHRLNDKIHSHSIDQQISTPQLKITERKRLWQCKFCQTKNDSDVLICLECGANKINVYIPLMDRNERNHQQKFSASLNNSPRHSQREERVRRRSVFVNHKREADEGVVLKHIEQIRRTNLDHYGKFKDQTFPASNQSIFINGNSFSRNTIALLPDQQTSLTSINNQIQWLRPDQIIPSDWSDNSRTSWTIFRDPKPNDVVQGALGDCWFITALSVLAEEPKYLKRVVITQQYNNEGIYCVRLCKDGEWTQVLVDDRLPCTSNRRLAYSQAQRKQLWVPLIEKALAKLNGSYESIIAGRCCEGLSTVTGCPCETLILGRTKNPDDKNVDFDLLWSKLVYAQTQRFLMCAMCSNDLISKEEFEKSGLLNIHAYSLQDIRQSRDGKHRLVKLRNPWGGTYRWTGDWSDNSHLWIENSDLRHELLDEKRNKRDGVFWMPFHSFVKYFECVDICKLRPNWYEVRDSTQFYPEIKQMHVYFLTITYPTEIDITLHRKISKNLRVHRSDVSLCIAVVNIEEQSNGYYRIYSMPIVSPRGQHKFISTDGQLQPGVYIILPFLFNQTNRYLENTEFTIAIHSSHVVELERRKFSIQIEREFLIKFCIFFGEQTRLSTTSDGVTIYELKKTYWDGLVLLVENRHSNQYVHFNFRCTISQNASISRKNSQQDLIDIIPPNHRQIIVMISRKNPSQSFTIGHDFRYILSSRSFIKTNDGNQQKHWPTIDESLTSDDIHLPQLISSAKQFN